MLHLSLVLLMLSVGNPYLFKLFPFYPFDRLTRKKEKVLLHLAPKVCQNVQKKRYFRSNLFLIMHGPLVCEQMSLLLLFLYMPAVFSVHESTCVLALSGLRFIDYGGAYTQSVLVLKDPIFRKPINVRILQYISMLTPNATFLQGLYLECSVSLLKDLLHADSSLFAIFYWLSVSSTVEKMLLVFGHQLMKTIGLIMSCIQYLADGKGSGSFFSCGYLFFFFSNRSCT